MQGREPMPTLLATLGGQPQVVTLSLDLLLQQNIPIREVVVVHPASYAGLEHSIRRLNDEFPGDIYKCTGQPIRLRRHALRQYGALIDDIVDEQSADGALNAMDDLIRDLKQSNRTIHFSISGGRRLMGFLSFSAALLNFSQADRLWHIHTPETVKLRVQDGAAMHVAPEDGVRLIEVPFARLAQPILSRLLSANPHDARTVMSAQAARADAEQQQRCRQIAETVTGAQRRVLRALASGLRPQEVADRLGISIRTVSSHTSVLLRECRNTWNIPEDKRLDYTFLHFMFANYFSDGA